MVTQVSDRSARPTQTEPLHRVVLLGASNLTRAISTVVRLAQMTFDGPLELLAALGGGRSYGMTSRVLVRELPAISECGLWDALETAGGRPTSALVTDIGNDLFYGASPVEIVAWVELALDRLARHEARTVLTLLPADNAEAISAWRFRVMRGMMFRHCSLEFEEVKALVLELNERLRAVARGRGIHLVRQRAEWYGFDPIHIRMSQWPRAWREILSAWQTDSEKIFSPKSSPRRWLYLRSLAPLERTILGRVRRAAQPAGRLSDGTTISFF